MEKKRANCVEHYDGIIEFYKSGYYNHIDQDKIQKEHLKPSSEEFKLLNKIKIILYISHVSHHEMGKNSSFPFCLIGTTGFLKQFIHGKYEFLLVFSHFDNRDWQQNTLNVIKFIRKRKEISERRPLVNFYVLISNAVTLKQEIDKIKGGTESAVIPFSFNEILLCKNNEDLKKLFLERFDEYLYENNMLGEELPIEEDMLLFGDRGKIADAIVSRCKDNKHSGIFGLRRSGKSSVLNAVLRRLDNESVKYIKIESRSSLEMIDSWKTALYDIAKNIKIAVSGMEQKNDETREDFEKRIHLNSTESDYEKRPTSFFVQDVKLYTKDQSTFVIAIDEIELITYNTTSSKMWKDIDSFKGFWGALRDSGCSLVICRVNSTINETSIIEYNGKTCDNPMYERIHNCAGFSKTYLPAFSDEQTKIMINTLGSYSNIAFNNIYVDINRAFGGQPYAIRQFCSFMFEKIKKYRKHNELYEISKPSFNALINEFNNSSKGIQLYTTILQHIAIYKNEYDLLKRLALSPEKYHSIEGSDLLLIDHIEKYGLIEYDRHTKYISFNIQSVQEYIKKTSNKKPEDMNNDERRQYVQNNVANCEKKLKTYIYNYYIYNGGEAAGKKALLQHNTGKTLLILKNPKAPTTLDIQKLTLKEIFNHDLCIIYFSSLSKIISNAWPTLGKSFQDSGIDRYRFITCMNDLNAGRTDADHYDAEDNSCPEHWDIDDQTLQSFITAVSTMNNFFEKYNI